MDHVEVAVTDAGDSWRLSLSNPTDFPAEVKVYIEKRTDFVKPWSPCAMDDCRIISVDGRGGAELLIEKNR